MVYIKFNKKKIDRFKRNMQRIPRLETKSRYKIT